MRPQRPAPLRFERRRLLVRFQTFVAPCGGVSAAMVESFHLATGRWNIVVCVGVACGADCPCSLDQTRRSLTWIFAGPPDFDHHDVGGPAKSDDAITRLLALQRESNRKERAL
jgi:hypothetical protein